jgi:dihydrofolate reductase
MTRRLIMWNLVTLDGFFEGPKKWDLDWHDYVWGDELNQFGLEQVRTADALLFGRVTYEGMAAYWSTAKGATAEGATAEFMNTVPKVVFSKTLAKADWNNTRLVRQDAAAEVAKLKNASGRNLFVFGSAELSATFIRHDLFDEYRLCVVPVVLGAGTPLFKPSAERKRMKLRESRTLKSGGVILFCEPERASD